MAICNGDCDCHPKPARACPCEDAVNACLARGKMPNCENKAYIPWITLPNLDAAKNVFNSLVQISENNTLYYIGCDQRVTKLVANPVEIDNYDLENNPNNLRSQFVIDFANNRGAYYNETGEYQIFYFGEHGGGGDEPITLRMNYPADSTAWERTTFDLVINSGNAHIVSFDITSPNVSFTDETSSQTYTPDDVFTLIENGGHVILNNVPLGMIDYGHNHMYFYTKVDGVDIDSHTKIFDPEAEEETMMGAEHSGMAFVSLTEFYSAPLGVSIVKLGSGNPAHVVVQGIITRPQ